jgi:hypothetical protein
VFPIRTPKDEAGFEHVVDGDRDRFKYASNGANGVCPFQCDLCHFRNIQGRNPRPLTNQQDRLAMDCIRRANLDAIWAREPSTIAGNLSQARKMERFGEALGFSHVVPPMGPFPLTDTFGMKVACCTLLKSLEPGKWEATVQYSTTRRLRSAFSNFFHASHWGEALSVMAYETQKLITTPCPTYGYWYQRFSLGMHKRMGDVVRSDYAVTSLIVKELLEQLDSEWETSKNEKERKRIADMGLLISAGFLCGLRGEEIMKIDLGGLIKYLEAGRGHSECPHVIVALLGRLKGETGERYHMMVMARESASGIIGGIWADRVVEVNRSIDRTKGWVFTKGRARQAKIANFEDEFINRLEGLRIVRPGLFEPGIDIAVAYSLFRSLRRGSNTEAIRNKVEATIIDMNNRWRKFERARGRMPSLSMQQHYTQMQGVLAALWTYSRAL